MSSIVTMLEDSQPTYDVLAVNVAVPERGYGPLVEDRVDEIERYLYGRSFYLGFRSTNETSTTRNSMTHVDLFFIVDSFYTQAVIPRLASGLHYARVATPEERYSWGF